MSDSLVVAPPQSAPSDTSSPTSNSAAAGCIPKKGRALSGTECGLNERPAVAEQDGTEGEHGRCAGATPLRVPLGRGLLHASLDDDFTGRLDHTTADRTASLAEFSLAQCFRDGFRARLAARI